MNRSYFALFVAVLIHLLLLLLYLRIEDYKPENKKNVQEKKIKIHLRTLPKKKKIQKTLAPIQEEIKAIEEMPVMPKGSQLTKIIQKKSLIYKPKSKVKKTKLNPKPIIKKRTPKIKRIPLPPKKTHIPLIKRKKEKKQESSSMDWLLEDKSDAIIEEEKTLNHLGMSSGKNIQELYGDEFGKLTPGQQEYILNNQEIMKRITQGVLNRQARVSNINKINVNRSNVIEFYLHPDGSMSDFKFLNKSGYFILDEITRVTIEYAYAKYPRPSEKTLIRYNVFYNLLR